MLTLLSPLIGIVGSLLPKVVGIFERKQELQYEIELTKVKIEAATMAAKHELDLENIKADVSEGESLRSHDTNIDGGFIPNALRASIRPIITYVFFGLFVSVKIAAAYVMLTGGQSVPQMLDAVWDGETMALFSTIMAFWFGSRVIEKMDQRVNKNQISTLNITSKK